MSNQVSTMLLAILAITVVVVWLLFIATAITRKQPIWSILMVCFPLVALLYIPEYIGGKDEDDEEEKTV